MPSPIQAGQLRVRDLVDGRRGVRFGTGSRFYPYIGVGQGRTIWKTLTERSRRFADGGRTERREREARSSPRHRRRFAPQRFAARDPLPQMKAVYRVARQLQARHALAAERGAPVREVEV